MVAHELAQEREAVARDQLLGDALELEEVYVPGLLVPLDRTGEGRVPGRDRHEAVNALRVAGGERPADIGAPVVADQMRARDAEGIEHTHRVGDEPGQEVGLDLGGPVRSPEPALIHGDDPIASRLQRRHLVSPQRPAIGEAVQEEDGRTIADVDDVEIHAVDAVHRGARRELLFGHDPFRSLPDLGLATSSARVARSRSSTIA